ncbi:MAG: glutamine-hydrolyzing GMP synthase, partial [Chitinivibrionales bacterium]|nr:glutamine-hydrolyzing GMP synthase [Chitinivibrionales bacterium]MBD3358374.1 glutamine-hydrolyzing GMP synthase [Chitinivibrionales bacterium]
GVYSEIVPCETDLGVPTDYKGVILSGGPHSVLDSDSPEVSKEIFELGVPILGLCYGHQLIAKMLGGSIARGDICEYGSARLSVVRPNELLEGLGEDERIWMSHGDTVISLPEGFEVFGSTDNCINAAVGDPRRKVFGLQFHPEVTDTPNGMKILDNFLNMCGCRRQWNAEAFFREIRDQIIRTCAGRKVFLLVSGGVDSAVAFSLLNEALGADRVLGLHIDNGLMRLGESEEIMSYMKEHGFSNLHVIDAGERFLERLERVADPEEKRKIIGATFLEAKEQALRERGLKGDEWLLGQGTIYPDTIESAGTKHADRIKTHHNRVDVVLELIEQGLVVEPLAQLYKDEVRTLGETLGLPRTLLWRHPFPGPGLGVRVLCSDGAEEPVERTVVRDVADRASVAGYESTVLPVRSVGVQGDGRTYAHPALLLGPRDWPVLERLSTELTNSVAGINRVVYGLDVSGSTEYELVEAYLTGERLDKLRLVDHLVTNALRETGEYEAIWQMPVVLLPLVNKDGGECVVLRPIRSQEAMTVRFVPLSQFALDSIIRGVREIEGVGDIFLDITHKPPGTIEWE